jgi:hypothetical protein
MLHHASIVILNKVFYFIMSQAGLTEQEFIRLFGEKNLITLKDNATVDNDKDKNISRNDTISPSSDSQDNKPKTKQVKKNTKKVKQEIKKVSPEPQQQIKTPSTIENNPNKQKINVTQNKFVGNKDVFLQSNINHKEETIKLLNNINNFISGNKHYNFNVIINSQKDKCTEELKNTLSKDIITCSSPETKIEDNIFVLFDKSNYDDKIKQNLKKKLFKCVGSNVKTYNSDTDKMVYIPYKQNPEFIRSISNVSNFLLIKDYSIFHTKARFLLTLKNNDCDLIIMDPCFKKDHYFSEKDLNFIRYKNGNNLKQRLLYACISIKKIKKYSKYYNINYCNTKEDINDFVKIDYWKNEWFNTLCGHIDISYVGFLIKTGYDGIFIDDCDF